MLWKTSFNSCSIFIHEFIFWMLSYELLYYMSLYDIIVVSNYYNIIIPNLLVVIPITVMVILALCYCFWDNFFFEKPTFFSHGLIPNALSHYLLRCESKSECIWQFSVLDQSALIGMWFTQVWSVSVTNVAMRTDRAVSKTLKWIPQCCSVVAGQDWNKQYNREKSSTSLNNSNNKLTTHLCGCLSAEKPDKESRTSRYKSESKENCYNVAEYSLNICKNC